MAKETIDLLGEIKGIGRMPYEVKKCGGNVGVLREGMSERQAPFTLYGMPAQLIRVLEGVGEYRGKLLLVCPRLCTMENGERVCGVTQEEMLELDARIRGEKNPSGGVVINQACTKLGKDE